MVMSTFGAIRSGWQTKTIWVVLLGIAPLGPPEAFGQFGIDPLLTTELSDDIRLDEADSETRAHLERVEAFLAGGQWDEAVETLRRVTENRGEKLVPLPPASAPAAAGDRNYMTVGQYGQWRLAAWAREAPEALQLYRDRVDPLAGRWTQQGIEERDEVLLRRVVEQLFASSYGDNALFALGEIYLARGWHARARGCWERISPLLRAPANPQPPLTGAAGGPLWLALHGATLPDDWPSIEPQLTTAATPPGWLAYPDPDLDLAEVRARLVLTSILEGSPDRAAVELDLLRRLHPDATGRLAGRDVVLAEFLTGLLEQSSDWPPPRTSADWPTFAGSPARHKILPEGVDVAGGPIWRLRLGPARVASGSLPEYLDFGSRRVAEKANRLLSYHPVLAGGLVFVNDESHIRAARLTDGQPWPPGSEGEIYRPTAEPTTAGRRDPRQVGVPRFTMTIRDHKLFARMGSPVTSYPTDEFTRLPDKGYLVGLDLNRQGRLLPGFPITLDAASPWMFEGAPLADAAHLYVAMRRSDVRPQAHVACYRLTDGRLKWRRLVSAAETPGRGDLAETTHNLLTLHEGIIFYNTNLGTVASLETADGRLRWITCYPRAKHRDEDRGVANFYRDLNPCLADRSLVFAAPTDAEHIFAFDASTGQIVWQTDPDAGGPARQLTGGSLLMGEGMMLLVTAEELIALSETGTPPPEPTRPQPED